MVVRHFSAVSHEVRSLLWDLAQDAKRWPGLLYGPAGTGKTCAALCLCDVSETACYLTVEGVMDAIVRGKEADFDWINRVDLAVLDEIGIRTNAKDLDYVAVKRFADLRGTRPTLYITNLKPQDLSTCYDDRIFSRVACGTWINCQGKDRRFV